MNRDDCLLSPRDVKSWFFLVLPHRFIHLLPVASLFSFMATAVRLKESVFVFLATWEREKGGPPCSPVQVTVPALPANDKRFIDN